MKIRAFVCVVLCAFASVVSASGTVSGIVRDANTNAPLDNVQVAIIPAGGGAAWTTTDATGAYSVAVDAGSYYVRASASDFLAELYPNAVCRLQNGYGIDDCDLASAQQISVSDGANLANIDLALSKGGSIAGVVRNDVNQPIGASVMLYDSAGNEFRTGNTDNYGHYKFATLAPGAYRVQAQAGAAQMYKLLTCDGPLHQHCDLTQATTLTVTSAAEDFISIDFVLPHLASVEGTVATEDSGPLAGAVVAVLDANGNLWEWAYPDSFGHYVASTLGIGTYYLYATNQDYFSQIYQGIDCPADCTQSLSSATPIVISADSQRLTADFLLHSLPRVHGHVHDAASGLPLANVQIAVSATPPATFWQAASTLTDMFGEYSMVIPPGSYYLWAMSLDHVDKVYPDVICNAYSTFGSYPDCDVSTAVLVSVAPGKSLGAFDFALNASSAVKGRAIIRAGAGSDVGAFVTVYAFDTTGTPVAHAPTDTSGNFVLGDLSPGTYFAVAAQNDQNYVEQLWKQTDCPNTCSPTTGTPIVVGQGATVSGVDFQLTSRNAIVGRVTDTLGAPVGGALVDVFGTTDDAYLGSGIADAEGYYIAAAQAGASYFVATEAGSGFEDQVYSGIACPLGSAYYGLCPLTNATAVSLPQASTQPHIVNFFLQRGNEIFGDGFD